MSEREVSLSEAQERLPELLREIERGDTLAITRNGKQVARLAPPEPNGAKSRRRGDAGGGIGAAHGGRREVQQKGC